MLRQIDPDLDPAAQSRKRERTPPTPAEPSATDDGESGLPLRGGQRRTLDDVLNPARFRRADGYVEPSTLHTPLSLIILALALLMLFAFLMLPWIVIDSSSGTGISLFLAAFRAHAISGDMPIALAPLGLFLAAAAFLAARAGLTVLYREPPVRGIWFWMVLAGAIGLYPLVHTLGVLDVGAAAITGAPLNDVRAGLESAAPGIGWWLAALALGVAILLTAAGWLFLSHRAPRARK
ncbi:MAG: hypothetical protein IT323_09155 [Anaerolineae bacterium]|nr:hypothetical protein [Anaerolineae bacterium]